MADSLSCACPTCDGAGYDLHSRMANRRPCPDCIDGYPKAAVERAAKVIADFFDNWCDDAPYWPTDDLMIYNHDIRKDALAAIRAFHNEGSEQ